MADTSRVRIRIPSAIKSGDVVRVRALVIHPTEIVQRDKQGVIIQKNYNFIHTIAVTYNNKEIMRAETTQALSQNPAFTFALKVDRPGRLTVTFLDTTGSTHEGAADIKFS